MWRIWVRPENVVKSLKYVTQQAIGLVKEESYGGCLMAFKKYLLWINVQEICFSPSNRLASQVQCQTHDVLHWKWSLFLFENTDNIQTKFVTSIARVFYHGHCTLWLWTYFLHTSMQKHIVHMDYNTHKSSSPRLISTMPSTIPWQHWRILLSVLRFKWHLKQCEHISVSWLIQSQGLFNSRPSCHASTEAATKNYNFVL